MTSDQIKEPWDKEQPFVQSRKLQGPSTRKFNYNRMKQNPDIVVAFISKKEEFDCNSMDKRYLDWPIC